jgi:hypothetical protein
MCLLFGPTISTTSSSSSSASTPSPIPTERASNPSFRRADQLAQRLLNAWRQRKLITFDLLQRDRPHGVPPVSNDDFDNSPRSPRDRTRREDRHLKFYELRDNLVTGVEEYAFESSEALVESMLGRQLIPGEEYALVTAARQWLTRNGCPRERMRAGVAATW